jgi:hypothetical protein
MVNHARAPGANSLHDACVSRHAARPTLLLIALLSAGLVATQAFALKAGAPMGDLTRDPVAGIGRPPYVGLISNAGIAGWAVAAVLGSFGWMKLRKAPEHASRAALLLGLALVACLLGLDDLAELHEEVYPRVLALRERVIFLFYGLGTAALLWNHRALILREASWPLGAACLCFAGSILFDQLHTFGGVFHHLLEDGAKVLGIGCWGLGAGTLLSRGLEPARA